jgi:hypothetical protein
MGRNLVCEFPPANGDYQAFKTQVLDPIAAGQKPAERWVILRARMRKSGVRKKMVGFSAECKPPNDRIITASCSR